METPYITSLFLCEFIHMMVHQSSVFYGPYDYKILEVLG